MNIPDAILFSMVAGVVTLKVFLLAAAAVLLVHVVTRRARQLRDAALLVRVEQPGLDKSA